MIQKIEKKFETKDEFFYFMKTQRTFIHDIILDSVEKCLILGCEEKTLICSFEIIDVNKNVFIYITPTLYVEVLNSCIKHFNSVDEFEKSSKALKLINKILESENDNKE